MSQLLDLIFPELCVTCKTYTNDPEHPYVCNGCFATIPFHQSSKCIGCNRQTNDGETCTLCRKDYAIDSVHVASSYTNKSLQNLVHCVKYQFVPTAAISVFNIVTKFMAHRDRNKKPSLMGQATIMIPVPLHKKRLNWRGFNQSEILTQMISDRYLVGANYDSLIRKRDSKPQVKIENRGERLKNLVNSFEIKNPAAIAGKDILLVDDVCTTGTTLNECAKVLKAANAKTVAGLVVAKG